MGCNGSSVVQHGQIDDLTFVPGLRMFLKRNYSRIFYYCLLDYFSMSV